MTHNKTFNIRVYGLVINQNKEILLTDEFRMGMKMTKFPGGGLQFGEGVLDCLRREIREECNGQEIEVIRHFYTTEFYQKALFFENRQLISIYYLISLKEPLKFKISDRPFDFEELIDGSQSFRLAKLKSLKEDDLSFPIDKFVAEQLIKNYINEDYCSGTGTSV